MADIRVLVVDDHDLVRASIQRVLADKDGIELVGEADSGENALKVVELTQPDVVLLDLKMPIMDGIKTARELLKRNPELKILVVSICLDDLLLPRLFQEGVSGYFSKTSGADEMVRAIQTVYAGQRYLSPILTPQLGHKQLENELFAFDTLSEREFQVVIMIIGGQTVAEISGILAINRKTINSYRSRSFQKLNIKNDVELTLLAARQGLLEHLA